MHASNNQDCAITLAGQPECNTAEIVSAALDPIVSTAVGMPEDDDWVPADPAQNVVPFPLRCLPPLLRQFAEGIARSIQCPPDLVAVPMLAVAGAAIGNSRSLRIGSLEEFPRLYLACVAPAGIGKSPALHAACAPVYRAQYQLQQAYEATKSDATFGLQPQEPLAPGMEHRYAGDTTTEQLAWLLAQNPRGLLMVQDELTAWVARHNQYRGGKGADRQVYQSCWGGVPMKVDRRSAPPLIVPHPFLCVVGCIPPSQLSILEQRGGGEDGFLHRILFSYPRVSDHRTWQWNCLDPDVPEAWNQVVSKLYALEMENGPVKVGLTAEARPIWEHWYNGHCLETEHRDFPVVLKGPWAKMVAYTARFALVVHLLRKQCDEVVTDDIDGESLQRAIDLIDYFKSHARVVYARFGASPATHRAQRVVDWIRAHGGQCHTSALVKNNVGGIEKQSEALAVMQELEDRGYGYTERRKAKNHRDVVWFTLKRMEASQMGWSRDASAGLAMTLSA